MERIDRVVAALVLLGVLGASLTISGAITAIASIAVGSPPPNEAIIALTIGAMMLLAYFGIVWRIMMGR